MQVMKQDVVEVLWFTPCALEVIEQAARTCYRSEAKGDPSAFIRKLIASGHEAMLEHAVASFRIVTDRGVTHEMVRHRLASYAQESTRWCNYAKDKFGGEITVIEQPFSNSESADVWRAALRHAENAYLQLIRNGETPQIARSVLPTCLKTEIVMTCNFREWRHFLKMRMSPQAHPMIRELAIKVYGWFRDTYPVIVEDFVTETVVTGHLRVDTGVVQEIRKPGCSHPATTRVGYDPRWKYTLHYCPLCRKHLAVLDGSGMVREVDGATGEFLTK